MREPAKANGATTTTSSLAQVYCQHNFDFLKQLLDFLPPSGDIQILDAGANVGFVSILLSQLVGGRGHVIAVEANPGTIKVHPERPKHERSVLRPSLRRAPLLLSRRPCKFSS